jgi:hypothetical protein
MLSPPTPRIYPKRMDCYWKPVLWFTKGKYDGIWTRDIAASRKHDKNFHVWGQSESGFAGLVSQHSKEGDVVCDPFVGGGTTGVISLRMKRNFIGIDDKQEHIDTSRNRFNQELYKAKFSNIFS